MAATSGTLYAIGRSGRTYVVDVYVPDATGTYWTFNPAGLAGTASPTSWRVPEDVTIYDYASGAAPTAVGAILNANGAIINGGALRFSNQLATLSNRGKLNLPVKAGDFIGATNY
jgi:hypothetical protein